MVDDDPKTLRFVRDALTRAGYTALVTGEHAEIAHIVHAEKPHLVVLDLMRNLADVPVVFISACGRDETIAEALTGGATNYIVKPTGLTARVGAALRKRAAPEPFSLAALAIHYEKRRVTVAGREADLTPTEYDLLRVLPLNAGRMVTFDALLVRQVWTGRETGNVDLVRNIVKKLSGTPGIGPGYSTCAASDTAWQGPTAAEGPPGYLRTGRPHGGRQEAGERAADRATLQGAATVRGHVHQFETFLST